MTKEQLKEIKNYQWELTVITLAFISTVNEKIGLAWIFIAFLFINGILNYIKNGTQNKKTTGSK